MTLSEIDNRINEINTSISHHKEEWMGMLGTQWEREDWIAKQKYKKWLLQKRKDMESPSTWITVVFSTSF